MQGDARQFDALQARNANAFALLLEYGEKRCIIECICNALPLPIVEELVDHLYPLGALSLLLTSNPNERVRENGLPQW